MGALTSTVPPVSFNCFRIPWRRGNSSASNWNRQMQRRLKWITAQFQLSCLCLYWLVYHNEVTWLKADWYLKYQPLFTECRTDGLEHQLPRRKPILERARMSYPSEIVFKKKSIMWYHELYNNTPSIVKSLKTHFYQSDLGKFIILSGIKCPCYNLLLSNCIIILRAN